ncbi:glycosyltransferase family 4 protein [Pseudonocardia eucalypti]|uniref:Glycosyltransferase family 4 protein n=1 Tax=Pseudonocardia eucalypti TaxID=648755 RepID=A0ABP9QA24_9PSEU|nr:glycogen(starch) synthase [Pseudonocardia eucalypti]
MRVLIVSWEYPPVVVGGLGRHVHALARRLAATGHDVRVLSRQPNGTDATTHPTLDETVDGVRVLRVAEDPAHLEFDRDMVAWTLGMNHGLLRAAPVWLDGWRPDVVHAHDWLVAHAAIGVADLLRVPLVATVHATEAGRHSGWLTSVISQQVHSVEWWLAQRADALITCSEAMRREVSELFDLDPADIHVLHNGIEPRRWRVERAEVDAVRTRYAPDGSALLLYFGRLEYEKGVQDLIAALPRIRRTHPGTRLLVAGDGTHADFLASRARTHRVRRAVHLLGHLPDRALAATLAAVNAVVLPSRYEPFGMVALETAAAETPLVASTAGGLGEVVRDRITGLSFAPGDVAGIAEAVRTVLDDPAAAAARARTAHARLRTDFDWSRITEATVAVYTATRPRPRDPIGKPKIPTGNAFGPDPR